MTQNDGNHPQRYINEEESLGARLRKAREERGMTINGVAEKLRLPVALIQAMERDDFERLGASVYARGYLNSYTRLLQVQTTLIDSALAQHVPSAPPLKSATRISRSRYLVDRYAKRAVYLVITASIVVPVVILATYDRLPMQSAILTALDTPPAEGTAAASLASTDTPATAPLQESEMAENYPVVASMVAPFYARSRAADPGLELPQPDGAGTAPAAGSMADPEPLQDGISLTFIGPSWVEVIGTDGQRLVYGLIEAGEQRHFAAGTVARVALGNAEAVEVRIAGEIADLTPYQRANVARFALSSDGELAPSNG